MDSKFIKAIFGEQISAAEAVKRAAEFNAKAKRFAAAQLLVKGESSALASDEGGGGEGGSGEGGSGEADVSREEFAAAVRLLNASRMELLQHDCSAANFDDTLKMTAEFGDANLVQIHRESEIEKIKYLITDNYLSGPSFEEVVGDDFVALSWRRIKNIYTSNRCQPEIIAELGGHTFIKEQLEQDDRFKDIEKLYLKLREIHLKSKTSEIPQSELDLLFNIVARISMLKKIHGVDFDIVPRTLEGHKRLFINGLLLEIEQIAKALVAKIQPKVVTVDGTMSELAILTMKTKIKRICHFELWQTLSQLPVSMRADIFNATFAGFKERVFISSADSAKAWLLRARCCHKSTETFMATYDNYYNTILTLILAQKYLKVDGMLAITNEEIDVICDAMAKMAAISYIADDCRVVPLQYIAAKNNELKTNFKFIQDTTLTVDALAHADIGFEYRFVTRAYALGITSDVETKSLRPGK